MPLRETALQGHTFLCLMYVGMISALLFDLCSPVFRCKSMLAHLGVDILLCTASVLMCFYALAATGCDTLRLYMALGLATGALLYRFGPRRAILYLANLIRRNRNSADRSE